MPRAGSSSAGTPASARPPPVEEPETCRRTVAERLPGLERLWVSDVDAHCLGADDRGALLRSEKDELFEVDMVTGARRWAIHDRRVAPNKVRWSPRFLVAAIFPGINEQEAGGVYAIDRATGIERWRWSCVWSPLALHVEGETVWVMHERKLTALDLETGEPMFTHALAVRHQKHDSVDRIEIVPLEGAVVVWSRSDDATLFERLEA
jgi:hypothetical protein